MKMKENFNPEKYGMVICPSCIGNGFIQNPERQCCPRWGGFGFIKNEKEDYSQNSDSSHKNLTFYMITEET